MPSPPEWLMVLGITTRTGAPVATDPDPALQWLASFSRGNWRPRIHRLPDIHLSEPTGHYAALGGMGRFPGNSQALVRDAIVDRRRAPEWSVLGPDPRLLVTAPRGFHPHAWHLRAGGLRLGSGHWLHRYAVVPGGAPLGVIAHELAHLLLDWPDWTRRSRIRAECLMGRHATAAYRAHAPPPCALLRMRMGWTRGRPITADTRLKHLEPGEVGIWFRADSPVLFEHRLRPHSLLAFRDGAEPRLLANVPVQEAQLRRPILALCGSELTEGPMPPVLSRAAKPV